MDVCAKVNFRPEMALTRLHLSELLLVHYSKERKVLVSVHDGGPGRIRTSDLSFIRAAL